MKTIFIDSDFHCHTVSKDGYIPVETDMFDGKSPNFIEGCCYVPIGMTYIRSDGQHFAGPVSFPWQSSDILEEYQNQYAEYELGKAELTVFYEKGVNSI